MFDEKKIIDDQLDFHEFKWWKGVKDQYHENVIMTLYQSFENMSDLIELIKNQDKELLEIIDNIDKEFILQLEEIRMSAELEAMAWEVTIGTSGIFKFDIPKNSNLSVTKKNQLIKDFIEVIKSCEDGEIAIALITACHASKSIQDDLGIDLYLPYAPQSVEPDLIGKIKKLTLSPTDKKSENILLDTLIKSANASEIVKAKFIIWIYTLIAASDIKLRGLGRELWKELSNGFDEIESHYEVMCQAFGKQLFIEKVREYPAGFSPKKEKPNKKATPSNIESQLEELQQLYKKKLITKEALTNMQLELLKEKIK